MVTKISRVRPGKVIETKQRKEAVTVVVSAIWDERNAMDIHAGAVNKLRVEASLSSKEKGG